MKILIVEDEKALSKSIAEYLSKQEYHCDVAANFHDAIDKIEYSDYDCILLDITLPDGDGLKILEQLKADKKTDGVLIISAKNSLDDKIKGLNLGADDYLSKASLLSCGCRGGTEVSRAFIKALYKRSLRSKLYDKAKSIGTGAENHRN